MPSRSPCSGLSPENMWISEGPLPKIGGLADLTGLCYHLRQWGHLGPCRKSLRVLRRRHGSSLTLGCLLMGCSASLHQLQIPSKICPAELPCVSDVCSFALCCFYTQSPLHATSGSVCTERQGTHWSSHTGLQHELVSCPHIFPTEIVRALCLQAEKHSH